MCPRFAGLVVPTAWQPPTSPEVARSKWPYGRHCVASWALELSPSVPPCVIPAGGPPSRIAAVAYWCHMWDEWRKHFFCVPLHFFDKPRIFNGLAASPLGLVTCGTVPLVGQK